MSGTRLVLALGCSTLTVSHPALGQFTFPKPEVFARAEDQQRTRLLTKICTEADVGRGCYRYDGHLLREAPCTYHINTGVIGSLPTDQCYKMEPARRYRGIWIDAFEGQQFIPEGMKVPEWPRGSPKTSEWRKEADRAIAATIWLDVERAKLGHKWQQGRRTSFIEFVGRKTMFSGNYGHMGMSGQEIVVDRVISLTECSKEATCSRKLTIRNPPFSDTSPVRSAFPLPQGGEAICCLDGKHTMMGPSALVAYDVRLGSRDGRGARINKGQPHRPLAKEGGIGLT